MKVKLGEVVEIIMGQSPDSSSYNYEDGLPFFQGNADFGEQYPTVRILCNKPKKIANKYDVLISVRAPVGAVNIANNTCAIGRGLAIIRTNANTVNHRYLFYLLKYHRIYIENLGTGSTFKAISKPILNDLCFTIHDIQTQKEIVSILDKVTSLISMRKEQLEKLDILVKSKFIEMFGDPVLNPKCWEKKKGNKLFNFTNGRFLSSSHRTQSGVPVFGGNGIAWYTNEPFIFFPTIIIGRVGENCGNIHYSTESIWVTDNAIYISKFLHNIFNLIYLSYEMNLLNFRSKAEGGGQPKITQKILNDCDYRIPPLDLQNQFAEFVEQVEKNKENIKSSLNQLEILYSALMQEYFG